MQPNADLARTLCATTGDSAESRLTEAAGVAACRQTGKQMPERDEMDVRNWTSPPSSLLPVMQRRDNYFLLLLLLFLLLLYCRRDIISFNDEKKRIYKIT